MCNSIKKNQSYKFSKTLQTMFTKTYKTLLRKIKEALKCKDISCSWIKRLNVVKITIFPKLIYRSNTKSQQLIWHTNSKIWIETQGTQNAQKRLETLLKSYRNQDWLHIENTKIKPYIYSQLISAMVSNTIQWVKNSSFN